MYAYHPACVFLHFYAYIISDNTGKCSKRAPAAQMAANTAPSVPPISDYPHAAALSSVPVAPPVSRGTTSAPSASPDIAPLTRALLRFSSEEVLGSNASAFNSALTVINHPFGRSPPFPALLVQPPQPLCEHVTSEENATTIEREGKECASASVSARAPKLAGGGGAQGPGDDSAEEDEDDGEEEEGLFSERVVVIRGSEQAVNAAERTLRRIVGRQPIRTRETMTVPQVCGACAAYISFVTNCAASDYSSPACWCVAGDRRDHRHEGTQRARVSAGVARARGGGAQRAFGGPLRAAQRHVRGCASSKAQSPVSSRVLSSRL